MKLNMKQKEYLLDEFFEPADLYKVFDSISRSYTLEQEWEIEPGDHGWWDLFLDDKFLTNLNFDVYPEYLKKLKKLS